MKNNVNSLIMYVSYTLQIVDDVTQRWCRGYHVCFTRRRSRVRFSLFVYSWGSIFVQIYCTFAYAYSSSLLIIFMQHTLQTLLFRLHRIHFTFQVSIRTNANMHLMGFRLHLLTLLTRTKIHSQTILPQK